MKKIEWKYNEPSTSILGVFGGNYVYHIGESYFSYNGSPNGNFIDEMFGVDTGEETAFYDDEEGDFVILLGDFRQEITERGIKTRSEALRFCKEKYPEHGGEMTTHREFNGFYI